MAGLIQKQMGGASAADEQTEEEKIEGAGPDGSAKHEAMEGEQPEQGDASDADEESSPIFQQALAYAYEVLYKGEAAKDVAKQLKAAPSVADGMADVAYNITSIVDERTNGEIPAELIGVMGMRILEEVAEIADAAGLSPTAEDVGGAFKTMLLRYLGEQGVDTSQLQQAMDQVDPSVFREAEAQA